MGRAEASILLTMSWPGRAWGIFRPAKKPPSGAGSQRASRSAKCSSISATSASLSKSRHRSTPGSLPALRAIRSVFRNGNSARSSKSRQK